MSILSRSSLHLMCGLALGTLLVAAPCAAESVSSGLRRDTKLYFTAPLRWDQREWLYFGGTVLAIGVAHGYDGHVRTHFTTDKEVLDGRDRHSLRDAAPTVALVAATWAFATIADDSAGYKETWAMLEAGGLSAISTTALKFAAGRRRPNETTRVNDWSRGGGSFPSLHTSAAFAIGTVFAESGGDDFRSIRRALGYGIAGATAYVRVRDNVHWLSDTVAAAALGMATAHFVMRREDARSQRTALSVTPVDGGAVLTYTVTLH